LSNDRWSLVIECLLDGGAYDEALLIRHVDTPVHASHAQLTSPGLDMRSAKEVFAGIHCA
jgi:hypothetical protein